MSHSIIYVIKIINFTNSEVIGTDDQCEKIFKGNEIDNNTHNRSINNVSHNRCVSPDCF